MRILIILGLVQTALLVFLVAAVGRSDKITEARETTGMPIPGSTMSELPYELPSAWENEIRQIFKEELDLASRRGDSAVRIAQSESDNLSTAADTRTDAEYRAERQAVMAQIDYFRSVGRISESEMAQLQMDMARLRPAERSLALQTLTRAMGSGEIEGRF